ncbi:MAG: hypothetical protein VX519_04125 [Myxococcota bacterium]|nr:hypothetical protein [Myxococcota bacterium]
MHRLSFFPLSVVLLCGCPWQSQTRYEFPVFSEDGESAAAVVTTYESQRGITHDDERNHQIQVLVSETPESSLPPEIGDPIDGKLIDYPSPEFYFMSAQGYIIIGREGPDIEDPDGSMQNTIGFDQVHLDGSRTSLAEGLFLTHIRCESGGGDTLSPLRIIPSPDGTLLARFEAETTCTERTLQVSLLDAATTEVLAGPFEVPTPDSDVAGPHYSDVKLGWLEDNAFAVGFSSHGGSEDSLDSMLYRLTEEPELNVALSGDCFSPPTTSSDTNTAGEVLVIDEETGEIYIEPEELGRSFGCND